MRTEAEYKALQAELQAIADRTGMYLCDSNVDHENVCEVFEHGTAAYWDQMHYAACCAAGSRAESEGQNINILIGRNIY